jgi:hypothetical protein
VRVRRLDPGLHQEPFQTVKGPYASDRQPAYDNLEITLKGGTPTVDGRQQTLLKLTSGMLIPLRFPVGITKAALACSREIWEKSAHHDPKPKPREAPPIDYQTLSEAVRKEYPHEPAANELGRRQQFAVYQYLHDLVHHGPEFFQSYLAKLESVTPDSLLQLPVEKTEHLPLEAVDADQGTKGGNIMGQERLWGQGAVGEDNIGNNVGITHGDLKTGEMNENIQRTRSREKTPWARFQFMVFCMGLFHLKMACADAIWKLCIQPIAARNKQNENSLFAFVEQLRPKESGKFIQGKSPAFRRMHEVIKHVGVVLRLDRWRVAVAAEKPEWSSLDAMAISQPTWAQLVSAVENLAWKETWAELEEQHRKKDHRRDRVYENMLVIGLLFLLYEELTWAINFGDIGRVKDLFIPWILVFRSCGKNKYAQYMAKTLRNLYFVFPKTLA